MKKRFFPILLMLCLLLTSCGSEYEIKPGKQADFEKRSNGALVIAEEYTAPTTEKTVVQQPGAYFFKESRWGGDKKQGADYVPASGAQAYIDMLVNECGFELFYEKYDYVYNTWCFVHPDSNKEPGNYGSNYDVKVRHYYAATTSTVDVWIDVEIDTNLFEFGDLGHRWYENFRCEQVSGTYAKDAFLLRNGRYYNESDGKLWVKSGERNESLYTYTKPFASYFLGFYGDSGLCSMIINGGKAKQYPALIADYETFDSSSSDIISVIDEKGHRIVEITWKQKTLEVGEVYDLSDFNFTNLANFKFFYDDLEFEGTDAACLTLRPLWIDREGKTESVFYFYGEFPGEEEFYTVEGLVAAPFCLEENSEKYYSESPGGSRGSGSLFSGSDGPYIPHHSKLDCLTCGGDGDCNTCRGYGKVERYAGGGDTITSNCSSCYGSGNCRTCGGSGKR